jgi:hypothetical protein
VSIRLPIAFSLLSVLAVVGCGATPVDPDVVGTWLATAGDPPGVVAVFHDDGTFTWSQGDINGTFEADGTHLTTHPSEEHSFCARGSLTWEYEVAADTMTADVVSSDCPEGPLFIPPESPDWVFERQP